MGKWSFWSTNIWKYCETSLQTSKHLTSISAQNRPSIETANIHLSMRCDLQGRHFDRGSWSCDGKILADVMNLSVMGLVFVTLHKRINFLAYEATQKTGKLWMNEMYSRQIFPQSFSLQRKQGNSWLQMTAWRDLTVH